MGLCMGCGSPAFPLWFSLPVISSSSDSNEVVSIAVFKSDGPIKVLIIQRGSSPYKGGWCLPCGHIHVGEATNDAANRELHEETGLSVDNMVKVGTYEPYDDDYKSVSLYAALADANAKALPASDAADAKWVDVADLPELLFDDEVHIKNAYLSIFGR